MGLETVELVLAYEERFKITIADEDVPKLLTVGAMCDYIFTATRNQSNPPDYETIFRDVVDITHDQLGTPKDLIKKDSNYVYDLGCD